MKERSISTKKYADSFTNICMAIAYVLIIIVVCSQIYFAFKLYNKLSPIADPYSESDSIRAGEGYVDKGVFLNAGLPDIIYGGRFNYEGTLGWYIKDSPPVPATSIYTHYPPGPDLLVGVFTKIYGKGQIFYFRLFPILFGLLCLIFFLVLMRSAIGVLKSLILLVFMFLAPMTYNMMHGLHYQGYSMSLFIAQMGILCYYFKKSPAASSKFNLSLFFIGFLQGWLCFDYFFLVSLAAIPFFVLYSSPSNRINRLKLLFSILFPFIGFALAHFLHLVQVSLYYGSIQKAIVDVIGDASPSSGSANIIDRLLTLKHYLLILKRPKYLGINQINFMYVLMFLMLIKEADILILRPLKLHLQWKSSSKNYIAVALSFSIPSLWVLIMHHHAIEHTHFLPRHYFFMYFFVILTAVECLKTIDSV